MEDNKSLKVGDRVIATAHIRGPQIGTVVMIEPQSTRYVWLSLDSEPNDRPWHASVTHLKHA